MLKVKHTISIKPEYNPNNAVFRAGENPGVLFIEENVHPSLDEDFVRSNEVLMKDILTDNEFIYSKYFNIKSEIASYDEVAK